MNFSSLVLMERDKETNLFVKELGSYEVGEGAEYVKKLYAVGNEIFMYFDTNKDVEEWEYTAVFHCFDEEAFINNGFEIEEIDEEYNPTWKLKFDYIEEHSEMKEKINKACMLINNELGRVFEEIQNKKEDYL